MTFTLLTQFALGGTSSVKTVKTAPIQPRFQVPLLLVPRSARERTLGTRLRLKQLLALLTSSSEPARNEKYASLTLKV